MNLLTRYKGSLVGAVIGDCIGAEFEGTWSVKLSDLMRHVKSIERTRNLKTCPKREYTDDTAMAISVAASLIEKKGLDVRDMAKRFSDKYNAEPHRGYGGSVINLFGSLGDANIPDIFAPAKEQFDGQGSYGNGGAMRIAPAGVFCHSQQYDFPKLKDLVSQITRLTHSNSNAITGAVLQGLAVMTALNLDQAKPVDTDAFLDSLLTHIKPMEEEECSKKETDKEELPYTAKLEKVREFVKREHVEVTEVQEVLGANVSALESVPTAVYSYLRASRDIPGFEDRNPFERTVLYAISLGGDTDTIATMAAAIAGAHYGEDVIPESWNQISEGTDQAAAFGQQLHDMCVKT